MGTRKLTLSAPDDVIKDAKRIAAKNRTSVSAMFVRLLSAIARSDDESDMPLGPVTMQATGIMDLPIERPEREILEDALEEKYGRNQ